MAPSFWSRLKQRNTAPAHPKLPFHPTDVPGLWSRWLRWFAAMLRPMPTKHARRSTCVLNVEVLELRTLFSFST